MRRSRNLLIVIAIGLLPFVVAAEQEKKESEPAAAAESKGANGTWKWTSTFGGNEVETTLKLKQDGEKLTGTISGFGGNESQIQDGTIKDGNVTFKVTRDFGGNKSVTTYTGTLTGESLKGKSETVFTREFDAKKEK